MRENLRQLARCLRQIRRADGTALPSAALASLAAALVGLVPVWLLSWLVNSIALNRTLVQMMPVALGCITAVFVLSVIRKRFDTLFLPHMELSNDLTEWAYCEKTLSMDFQTLDSKQVTDLRTKIENDNSWGGGIYAMNNQFKELSLGFFNLVVAILLMLPLLATPGFWNSALTPVFLVFAVGLSALAARLQERSVRRENEVRSEFDWRTSRSIYLQRHVGYREGKDIRIYGAQPLIRASLDDSPAEDRLVRRLTALQSRMGGIDGAISGLLLGGAYLFVVTRALSGALSAGDVVLFAAGSYRFCEGLKGFVRSYSEISVSAARLQSSFDYLELPGSMQREAGAIDATDAPSVEFRNVSFSYPGTETSIFSNLSITLEPRQRVAIVGRNGSGKTTFVKLLCRLYDPDEGQILLNGVDIRTLDYEAYLRLLSVVFQDFRLLAFPLGENVACAKTYDPDRTEASLIKAGLEARLREMPHGLETDLYRDLEEDGVEISGGEAQKISLARALYKDAPIVVLDEPTAALDPVSEFEIYHRFNEMVAGKLAVFVSHRLSSCRFCDHVLVFDDGRIVQQGPHEQLLEDSDGLYAKLWYAQAQYYAESES